MSVSTACFVFVKTSSRTVFANMSNHQSQDLPSNQQCCDNGPAPDGISPPPPAFDWDTILKSHFCKWLAFERDGGGGDKAGERDKSRH